MNLVSPLGLLWLASIPVLVWLWRFAASKHHTLLPSLIPFEHLMRRSPKRRTRLLVNWLFWLQLAALALIALALAQPILLGRSARTILVLLDTSASMQASAGSVPAFDQAKHALLTRLSRAHPGERFFVATTAPIGTLTQEPTSDTLQLSQLIERVATADLPGNLSMTHRIARALLGVRPDETLVLTDEPKPERLEPGVDVRSFGQPLPNVAIVGVDAHEPLCTPSESKLVVTVQNFADVGQAVRLVVRHDGQPVAHAAQSLEAGGRTPLALSLPPDASGLFEVVLSAERDALSVDDRAFVTLHGTAPIPAVVASDRTAFLATMGSWLDACPKITWKSLPPDAAPPAAHRAFADRILITDQPQLASDWPSASLVFLHPTEGTRVRLAQWVVDPAHPIGEYLQPLETVATAVAPSLAEAAVGDPIIWAVVDGQKIPLVRAATSHGRRVVTMLEDPTAGSVPQVMVFLNSLRWLTGTLGVVTTGEPLTVGPFEPGVVRVQRPGGAIELIPHGGGWLRYDATDRAGRYAFAQGGASIERVVNFLDPVESNTMQRVSTWGGDVSATASAGPHEPPRQPLTSWLLAALFVMLLVEWWLYSRRGRRA